MEEEGEEEEEEEEWCSGVVPLGSTGAVPLPAVGELVSLPPRPIIHDHTDRAAGRPVDMRLLLPPPLCDERNDAGVQG